MNIRGVLVRILDTAGIRETMDQVEKIGVERSKELTREADLILILLDASNPLEKEDREILDWLKDRKVLILLNKTDRPPAVSEEDIRCITDKRVIKPPCWMVPIGSGGGLHIRFGLFRRSGEQEYGYDNQ